MRNLTRLAASLAVVALTGTLACSEALDDGSLETTADTTGAATTTEASLELAHPGKDGILESANLTTPWGTIPVTYERFGEEAIFEGDMILDEALLHQSHDGETHTIQQALAANPDRLWPAGVVPYTFDASLPNPQRVRDAIAHWESKTPLRFVPRTNQADYVVFRDGTGCSASVGRVGGAQSVKLTSTCSTGNAIHEIGHAIGLWHTQARADRDSHVTINWSNVKAGKAGNFQTYTNRGRSGVDIGTYEVGSLMHYGSYHFSANGQPTIVRKSDGSTFTANRTALTGADVSSINSLYDPDGDGVLGGAQPAPAPAPAPEPEPEPAPAPAPVDTDGDGVADSADNCPNASNGNQADADGDGTGDVCDGDRDGDGVDNGPDNCPDNPNPDQTDADADGRGAPCDPDDGQTTAPTSPTEPTAPSCTDTVDTVDTDGDGLGDACDPDADGDGVPNEQDNCPLLANVDQLDADADGAGDVCDDTPAPGGSTGGNGNGNGSDNGVRRGHEVRGVDRNAATSGFGDESYETDETGEIDEEWSTYAAYNEAGENGPLSIDGGDAAGGGCSSTGGGSAPSAALLLLGFAFLGLRRRTRARIRA